MAVHNCELCGAMLPPRGMYFVTVAKYTSTIERRYQVCPACFDEREDPPVTAHPPVEPKE